jgi:hypothetical protein
MRPIFAAPPNFAMSHEETCAAMLHPISALVKRLELRAEILVQNS